MKNWEKDGRKNEKDQDPLKLSGPETKWNVVYRPRGCDTRQVRHWGLYVLWVRAKERLQSTIQITTQWMFIIKYRLKYKGLITCKAQYKLQLSEWEVWIAFAETVRVPGARPVTSSTRIMRDHMTFNYPKTKILSWIMCKNPDISHPLHSQHMIKICSGDYWRLI